MALTLTSPVFQPNGSIPKHYTCDGADVSPPLQWSGAPQETQAFVLVCDDPDAPNGTWDHWILFNIPANVTELEENIRKIRPISSRNGTNSWSQLGYGGPCPPKGQHRYFFKLYALDAALALPEGATKAEVEAAMQGHILAQADLIGLYQRS